MKSLGGAPATPQELILQTRRAKSLVITARLISKGGEAGRRAAAQLAVEASMLILKNQLGVSGQAAQVARLGLNAATAPFRSDGARVLEASVRGLARQHPMVYALQRTLAKPEPSAEEVAIRVERSALALAQLDPPTAKRLREVLRAVREVEENIRKAKAMRRQVLRVWKELKELWSEVRALAEGG